MAKRASATGRHDRHDEELDPGRLFDRRMATYLGGLNASALSRRAMLRTAGAAAGAAAVAGFTTGVGAAGPRPFLPSVSLVRQDGAELTFGLDGTIRGLEPALAYDFQANPIVCQISEGLMRFIDGGDMEPWLAESYDHPDALTYI